MPTFVPVTDSEKAKSEQSYYGKELLQHRRFDDPHSVIRGEDYTEKDDCAQHLKHAEGSNKMVKNEKGLWVKASSVGLSDTSDHTRGAGRGGGIPVIEHQSMSNRREYGDNDDIDLESRNYEDLSSRRRSDSRDKRGRDREKEKSNRKKRDRSGSNSSWSDVERYKRRPKREDSRDRHQKRHDSRDRHRRESSRERGHYKRDRETRRSGSREKKSKSKYDDKYHSRDREDDRRSSKDYEYDLSRESRKSRYRDDERDRRQSYDTDDNHRRKKTYSENEVDQNETLMEVEDLNPAPAEEPIQITAVQVVNHFHEVFEMNMRNQSDENSRRRLVNITQLFHEQCSIRSLRHVDKMYLTGKEAIEESFERTLPQKIVPSKRIFIESAMFSKSNFDQVFLVGPASAAQAKAYDENVVISYVVDFHRAGTSPGLGDMRKDTILLYECQQQYIMNIWGMNDTEKLADNEDLTEDVVYASKAFKCVKIVLEDKFSNAMDAERVDLAEIAHFHNYDKMEVWGF